MLDQIVAEVVFSLLHFEEALLVCHYKACIGIPLARSIYRFDFRSIDPFGSYVLLDHARLLALRCLFKYLIDFKCSDYSECILSFFEDSYNMILVAVAY